MGPARRGSKKSFCPRRAAAGESRYLLVVSTGRAGNGESVLIIAHSWGEKPSPPDWPHATKVNDTNNRLDHDTNLRITHLQDDFSVRSRIRSTPGLLCLSTRTALLQTPSR